MAGLALVAGRPGGDADPPVRQVPHQHLAGVARQGDGADMGGIPGADHLQPRHPAQPLQGVALGALQLLPVLRPPGGTGGGQGGDLGGGLGPRAQPPLLPAPQQQGLELQPLADILGADALGGPHLVAADGEQIHPQFPGSKGHLQKALDRVAVEQSGGRRCPGWPGRPGPPAGWCPARCSPASWTPALCPAGGRRSARPG